MSKFDFIDDNFCFSKAAVKKMKENPPSGRKYL